MRNRYPGHCVLCRSKVEKGQGHPERLGKVWGVRCTSCVGKGKKDPAKDYIKDGWI